MPIECAFLGTLAAAPKLKTSRNGKPYLNVRCAIDNDEKTQWISCVVFDAAAIENRTALDKGVRVYCEGKLSLNEWKADTGEQRHGLSVVSWEFHLAQIGRSRRRSRPKPKPAPMPPLQLEQQASGGTTFNDEIPFSPEWRA